MVPAERLKTIGYCRLGPKKKVDSDKGKEEQPVENQPGQRTYLEPSKQQKTSNTAQNMRTVIEKVFNQLNFAMTDDFKPKGVCWMTTAYISASPSTVRMVQVKNTLIDGGADSAFVPKKIVDFLKLKEHPSQSFSINTAMGHSYKVNSYVKFLVVVETVPAIVKAFVAPDSVGYCLLLGRDWMKEVKLVGSYSDEAYWIVDQDWKPHRVRPTHTKEDLAKQDLPISTKDKTANTDQSTKLLKRLKAEQLEQLTERLAKEIELECQEKDSEDKEEASDESDEESSSEDEDEEMPEWTEAEFRAGKVPAL
jgi:hypothetical protein